MLSYINDNFLHAPSTDMSKDVVRWLVDLMLAQAHEVLWEKTVNEGKGASLAAKLAASAAERYDHLERDSKEWVGKGVLNRSWAALVAVSFQHRSGRPSDLILTLLLTCATSAKRNTSVLLRSTTELARIMQQAIMARILCG